MNSNTKVSCPNCGIPCTGCAGARIVKATDGRTCCTKCIHQVEAQIMTNKINAKKNGV